MKITGLELIPVFSTREMGRSCPADLEKAVSHHVVVFLHTDAGIRGLGEMSDINFSPTPRAVSALRARLEAILVTRRPSGGILGCQKTSLVAVLSARRPVRRPGDSFVESTQKVTRRPEPQRKRPNKVQTNILQSG